MELMERLARDVNAEVGRAEVVAGRLVIHAWGEETFDPPVRFETSEAELRAHLSVLAKGAGDVLPSVEPLQGAYRLFLVDLGQEMATKVLSGSEIRLGDHRLRTSPERPPLDLGLPADGGPYVFLSPEQFRRQVRRRRAAKKRRRWR